MRAFFADGVDKMHIPWAVEGLPTLLHLSLFLFFGGLAIFLFNVDREVFKYVIWWFGLFFLVYGMITLLPLIRQDSPYNSPLSTPLWSLYTTMTCVTLMIFILFIFVCFFVCSLFCFCPEHFWRSVNPVLIRLEAPWKYYRYRMLGGVEMVVEEAVSKRSSETDLQILNWTISSLGDDDSLKSFFEAIPGFFDSKLGNNLKRDFPEELVDKFEAVLCGFVRRTCTSNSVDDSEKLRRLDMSLTASKRILCNISDRAVRDKLLYRLQDDEGPRTVEMGHVLARWLINDGGYTHADAQGIFARILVSVRERNDRWVMLAVRTFGLPEQDLWDNIALEDDSVLLFILIYITRRYPRSYGLIWRVLRALSKFNIRNTHPRLQHDFCTLWDEIAQKERNGQGSIPIFILKEIRRLYIALHQGADAAPPAFSAYNQPLDTTMFQPSSYPSCTLASHRPDSNPQISVLLHAPPGHSLHALSPSPTDGGNTTSRQTEHENNVIESATSEIGATSHGHEITPPIDPVHSDFPPSRTSPTAVQDAAPQDITSTDTLSRPVERSEHQDSDIVSPCAEPGSIASTRPPTKPTPAPIPLSLPKKSSESGVASVSNPLHFALPSIDSSNPASRPTGSATLPHLRPRGLVNARNICFANSVLQLLVNSPPSCNLFRELGDLKERRGAEVPLVDATLRFFKEFLVEEESPLVQQQPQPATGRTSRADERKKGNNVVDSLEPTYLYDAMKEKRQLKHLFVCSRAHVVAS